MGSFPPWLAGADFYKDPKDKEPEFGTTRPWSAPMLAAQAAGEVPGVLRDLVGGVTRGFQRAYSDPLGVWTSDTPRREPGTVLPTPRKISEDGTPRPAGHAAPDTQTGSEIPSPAFFQRPEPLQLPPVEPSSGIFAEFRGGDSGPVTYTNKPTLPGAKQVVEGRVNPEQERINTMLQALDAGMLTGDADAFAVLNKTLSEMNPLEAEEAMRRAQGPLAPLFLERQKKRAAYEGEQAQITGEQRQENIARRRVLGNEPEQSWLEKRATLIAEDLKQQLLSDPARQGRPLTRPEALQIEQEAKVRAEVMLSDLMMRSFFSQINRYPGSPTGGLDPFGG